VTRKDEEERLKEREEGGYGIKHEGKKDIVEDGKERGG
jgi:hypothetical protein